MIAFALPGFASLLPKDSVATGRLLVERFPNRELSLRLETDVDGQPCVLVGSVAPPDEQLLGLLLAADTLQRHGATEVAALLPYLGYARQDKQEPARGLGIAWIGRLLSACGVERIVTIDVHSARAGELLEVPLRSISPAGLLGAELERAELLGATVVAPDEGALGRCRAVAEAAGIEQPVAFLRKQRTPTGVVHGELVGHVGRRAVIIDDILDTGETLVSCCRELRRQGVEDMIVMVTHGLFTGEGWKTLPSLGVSRIYATDSVPSTARRAQEGARLLSVRPLLEQAALRSPDDVEPARP